MAKYEISDNVKNNILKLIKRTDIKGSEAVAVIEIIQTLSTPVIEKPEKKKDEEGKK